MELTKEQARHLAFAFMAHTSYREKLEEGAPPAVWETWERMRDEALREAIGVDYGELNTFAYGEVELT